MKHIFGYWKGLLIAFLLLAVCSEYISHLFLPPSIIQKLPTLEAVTHPVCGYKLEPNQTAYTLDKPATTNNMGYRDKNWTVEKPTGTIRVAIIGASFVFGYGVKDDEVFSRRLEEALNKTSLGGLRYEVMNFGVPAYDTGQMLCILKEEVLQFKPDVVLLTFFLTELFFVKDYSFYGEMFNFKKNNFKRWKWDLVNFFRHSRLLQYFWHVLRYKLNRREPLEIREILDAYIKQNISPPNGPKADGWSFVDQKLSELSALSREYHFKPYFMVTAPYQEITDKNTQSRYAYYLAARCRKKNIEPLVLVEALKNSHLKIDQYVLPYDYHFNPLGHQFVADYIAGPIQTLHLGSYENEGKSQ